MQNKKITIIEDETDILELIRYNLDKEGYHVEGFVSGETGLAHVREKRPDLLLLDLMLPGMDGLAVCRQLKSDNATSTIPIIMVSAKGEESDIVTGLELGADDYITKPFNPNILKARVRAMLRRIQEPVPSESSLITHHDLTLHPVKFQAYIQDEPLSLTKHEFQLLQFLMRHPGWVFTRYQIVNGVKGDNYVVTERAVDVQIAGLRKKLGKHSDYIETVRGVGYRFKE